MNESILFSQENEFIQNANIEALIDSKNKSIPSLFQNYEYPVSSWPVLLEQNKVNQLEQLTKRIPYLITKIPSLYFNNDTKKIADFYFEGNTFLAEYALMSCAKSSLVSSRLDLSYDQEGFKVLEANIGTSIGGWQIQSFEKEIRNQHLKLKNEKTRDQFLARDTQYHFVNFLIDQIVNIVGEEEVINIFIVLKEDKDLELLKEQSIIFFQNLINDVLEKDNSNYKVIVHSGNTSLLQMKSQKLYYNDDRIHAVLNMGAVELPKDVYRCFFMNSIYFPDNMATGLYGDKRNLGILRQLAEENKFNDTDNSLIKKHIPWTSFIEKKDISYDGKKWDMVDLLTTHKNNLVIKPFSGAQGKDVAIGKFLDTYEWKEIVRNAINTNDFIVQEFCEPKDIIAPNKNGVWGSHKLIWGAFGFGHTYGGVWVRMIESQSGSGVINSATGAVEAIVYEMVS